MSPAMKTIANGWFNAEYVLSKQQLISIRRAKSVGLIIQMAYDAPIFFGFDQMPFGEGAAKLDSLIEVCNSQSN